LYRVMKSDWKKYPRHVGSYASVRRLQRQAASM
jgi:hypothetical protein